MSIKAIYAPERTSVYPIYLGAVTLGFMYIINFTTAQALASEVDSLAAYIWQWSLMLGGALAFYGAMQPRKNYIKANLIEMVGAAMTAAAASVYVVILVASQSINGTPWATVIWITSIIITLIARIRQALKQRALGQVIEDKVTEESRRPS